jgi:polyhydroxybutyrate depolymerase
VGDAQTAGADDVGFVLDLINALSETYNLDHRRIYATGVSNGAMFAYRLACELSGKIAAVAAVSGTMEVEIARNCAPTRPISILHIHGTADPFAKWDGWESKSGGKLLSVPATIGRWIELNKCSTEPQVTLQKGDVTCETHHQCAGGAEVTLCKVQGGGHTWPGSSLQLPLRLLLGPTNKDVNASELIWEFFARHAM